MEVEPAPHTRSDRLVVAYARLVLRWRWVVLALTLAAVAGACLGFQNFHIRADYRYNFGERNPQLLAFEAMENVYGKTDSVLFFLAPDSGDVFNPETLEAVHWLTEQAWQVPYSTRVDSLANYQHTTAEGDDLVVADLIEDGEALDAVEIAHIREISLREPQIVGRLVPPNASGTAVAVNVQTPEGEGGVELEVTKFARDLLAQVDERFPNHRTALSGLAVMSATAEQASRDDLRTLVPLMYGVLIVMLFVFLRSAWGTFATMAVAALSAMMAMGIGFGAGIPFTQGSAMAPTIILTIAIADGVHILVTFAKERRLGLDPHESLVESLRINWQPVFLTSLTTAIGFLSLNYSDNAMFRDLGNITAIGVIAAWIFSISFLPALISLTPYRVRDERHIAGVTMEHFAEWLIAHRRAALLSVAGLLLAMAAMIPRIELNDTFTSMFDRSLAFRRDLDFMSERLPGLYQFQYSLVAGEADDINEPAYWDTLDAFATWLRTQPEVTHVSTLSDTLKRLNRSMHGDDPSAYRLPREREQSAQYLLLYEMSLPYGLDLNNQINVQRSSTKVTATIGALSSREMRAVDTRIQEWLRANAPPAMHVGGASPTLMFAHMSERNVRSMFRGTLVAFVLISLVLVVSLRSVKLGLLSLIPNMGPTVIAFGVWSLLIGRAGFSIAMVSACSLGIIVDATVHFLSKYLRAQRERNADAEEAVRYSISTVGSALWITFLVLIIGFSVLTLSPFEMNAHFGLLIAITISAALLTSFLLLPTLLIELEARRRPATELAEAG